MDKFYIFCNTYSTRDAWHVSSPWWWQEICQSSTIHYLCKVRCICESHETLPLESFQLHH